jgi:hypothetical protein
MEAIGPTAIVRIVRPNDRLAARRRLPALEMLAAQQRPHERPLDRHATTVRREHLGQIIIGVEQLDDERVVATALHAEVRPADYRLRERCSS